MRNLSRAILIIGASSVFLASAAAQELNIKIPLPPVPKIVVPKPPPRKIMIKPGVVQPPAPQPPVVEGSRDGGGGKFAKGRHRYEYYPDAQVYFDPARQLYFFMQANRWAARATLPPEINVRIGPRVTVQLDSERPYEFHDEVRRYYPYREGSRHRGGYDEGFDEGYQQGYNEGYNEGYSEGYNAGYRASYEQGYRDGYRACNHDRDKHGHDRGRR